MARPIMTVYFKYNFLIQFWNKINYLEKNNILK